MVCLQIKSSYGYFKDKHKPPARQPVPNGVYDVAVYAINKDSLSINGSDTLRWQDLIFENGQGSIKTSDTSFRHRYNRAYFVYDLDSINHTLDFKKEAGITLPILSFHFTMPDSNTIRLLGRQRNDSLTIVLKRTSRHFQLAENQFHWLSEHNR